MERFLRYERYEKTLQYCRSAIHNDWKSGFFPNT